MNKYLKNIFEIVKEISGKDISVYESSFIKKIISKRAELVCSSSLTTYIDYLKIDKSEITNILNALNINYSLFFRDIVTYSILEKQILPLLLLEKSSSNLIKIWSAGCSCGQEAYSIAMVVNSLISKLNCTKTVMIFGTDISEEAIKNAEKGIYQAQEIQNCKFVFANKYFSKNNDYYKIDDSIKNYATFSKYDLLDEHSTSPPESIFGNFNIIFCSNVLFYYNLSSQKIITEKIYSALSDNGYLVLGETESLHKSYKKYFDKIGSLSQIYQKK